MSTSIHWDRLEVGNRLAELAPCLRSVERGVQRGLQDSNRECRDTDSALLEPPIML